MFLRSLNRLNNKVTLKRALSQFSRYADKKPTNCPPIKETKPAECPPPECPPQAEACGGDGDAGDGGGSSTLSFPTLKRAEASGRCRMCFIPDEWFTCFYDVTGKTGFYVFMFTFGNYCVSKEVFIMEHEYYIGLSWIVILYFTVTKIGAKVGKALDKQVDELVASWEKQRSDEKNMYVEYIKEGELSQKRAQGQKQLMDAKKENIAMQLEAVYRERSMMVYRMVKGRLDYQVKKYQTEARLHQKWMIEWIIQNVMRSITPEFEQQAMKKAIADLEALASRA